MTETEKSYPKALETEIRRRDGFARALRKDDLEAFEEMMDTSRGYALEVGEAENSILFEPFVMSMLLGQEKRLKALEQNITRRTYEVL